MKRFSALLLSLFLMLPQGAVAQYVMDLGSLVTALRIGDFSRELDRFDQVNTVYVARVSEIAGIRLQGGRLDAVLADRARVLTYLRAIIGQNREAMKALERHHESLDDVIYLTTTGDNTATLYVDDR